MTRTADAVRAIRPVLRQTPNGWLAISETLAPLRIAVVGGTEQEAREAFSTSIEAWAQLREGPDPFGGSSAC
jgi:hypothetical protein